MLKTGMKTTTLINRYKEENTESESQTEVDNGVHPLHWAMSPGPSLMGTNPINGFKNGTNGSGLCKSISAVGETECWTGSPQDPLSETFNLDFKR